MDAAGGAAAGLYFGTDTGPGTNPWWYVDLGAALPVTTVQITAVPSAGLGVSGARLQGQ